MRLAALALACTLAACYDPALENCTISCAAGDHCGAGQVCGADGWCAVPAIAGHCDGARDARMTIDAPVSTKADAAAPDASASLCALGCTKGSCDGDTCVIDCRAAGSCAGDVHCPVNLPCRVECGDHACTGHVDCTKATSCDVTCSGDQSCQNEVDCGPGDCNVTCSGPRSCKAKNKCHPSCACDVACTGASSCMGGSECPQDGTTCHLGPGCTSQLATCDACP